MRWIKVNDINKDLITNEKLIYALNKLIETCDDENRKKELSDILEKLIAENKKQLWIFNITNKGWWKSSFYSVIK